MKNTKEKVSVTKEVKLVNNCGARAICKRDVLKLIVFCAITILSLLSIIFTESLESLLNFDYFASSVLTGEDTKIHFIDVGEGDCTVIELIDGKIIMIDNGPEGKWNKINTYFEKLKIPKKIDYLILTHTDKDHIGNTEKILENYTVTNIYLPKVYSNYEVANNLVTNSNYKVYDNLMWNNICLKIRNNLKSEHIIYLENFITINNNSGEKEIQDSYNICIFPPKQDYYEEDNDYSPVIWAKLGYHQILFTGDLGKEGELEFLESHKKMVEDPNIFNIDVLKVGHHGSKNSTSLEFVQKIKPLFSVISCGKGNNYGHPSNETINNLKTFNKNMKIYRTDLQNSILYKDSFKNGMSNITVNYNYENFDNVYFKLYYLVISIIVVAFIVFILPILLSKKYKVKHKNINNDIKKTKNNET